MAESAIMKTLNGRKVYDEDARKELEKIKNAAPGLVFDTVADMEAYVAANAGTLKVGQDLFIRAADVPDYWWDGTQAVPVETDLTEVRNELDQLSAAIAELGGTLVEPAEDDIPKVFFGGALQQTKDVAVVPFRYISKTRDISGYAEIKAQGNSSMSYPKKNQTVKLFRNADCTEKLKVDFKGWGAQNKHVYKANWIDLSHARNVVSARLWADVVKSRSNYAELPEPLRTSPNHGAVDGFPVKVYADGVYQGRYTLNIPKDKWAFNMDDTLDNHCVLCGENYASGCFRAAANINGNDWSDEIHDVVPESIKTRWNEVISFVMNSTDDEFKMNLGQYFDIPSLIDYHLFGLQSCGLDAYGKNQIYMTYDGQKWIASMYDMDSTWGLFWNGGSFVATDYPRTSYEDFQNESKEGNLLYIRLEQNFHEELQARWAELKNGALHIDNIINRFERFTDIAPAELVKEDYASTTGGGAFTGIPQQGKNNIQQLRGYALARLAYVDTYVEGLSPVVSVPCTGIALSDETLTFTAAGSKTLTATITPDGCTDPVIWKSNNITVAHVTSGEIVAVGNGECEITATCGNYSATCAVSVSGVTSDEEDDKNLLYSLSETEFDGTQTGIDTGVKLHDVEKDYTVFVDFTTILSSDLTGEYKLFNSETYTNGSWIGHKIDGVHGELNHLDFNNTKIITWENLWGKRSKFVFKVSSGKLTYAVNINGGGVGELTEYTGTQNYTGTSTYNAKIAIKYCGTVHSVKIWNGAKSDAECLAMVNS